MNERDSNEPDVPNGFGYVFSQVSASIIGGVLFAAIVNGIVKVMLGNSLSAAGFTFLMIICIPVAWGMRALVLRIFGSDR